MNDQDVVGQRNLQRVGAAVLLVGRLSYLATPDAAMSKRLACVVAPGSIALGDEKGLGHIGVCGINR
ncbi:hypothetical protein [Micromonospora sp. NPDC005203]|uniref:hypothetical protein n=1 Tax=Micromonospora sp. NPDC005203 TaxID=3364226 RepID=UPI0036B95584